ncbi:MAG TPA: hypothetical protein VMU42_04735, partial [Candidatus Sulfotelmatobacter sp.]|nr:hypothetical protein [Candidatus Sulfotelmatobacter sp.]
MHAARTAASRPHPRRRKGAARGWKARRRQLRRWRKRAARTRRQFAAAPRGLRLGVVALLLAAVLAAANLIYQVARKPSEMLLPASGVLAKTPA